MLEGDLHQHVHAVLQLGLQLLGGPHALPPEPARIPALQRPLAPHIPRQLQVSACGVPSRPQECASERLQDVLSLAGGLGSPAAVAEAQAVMGFGTRRR